MTTPWAVRSEATSRAGAPGRASRALRDVLGLTVEEFDPLLPGERITVRTHDGQEYAADVWSEYVVPGAGCETVAVFGDGRTAGRPALARRALGDGSAGGDAADRRRSGGGRGPGPRGRGHHARRAARDVELVVREGESGTFRFAVNHTGGEVKVVLPDGGQAAGPAGAVEVLQQQGADPSARPPPPTPGPTRRTRPSRPRGRTWTSPGTGLTRAVHDHTADVLGTLRRQGTPADLVQIGNEINGGLLWPEGKNWGADSGGWGNLTGTTRSGTAAVPDGPGLGYCYCYCYWEGAWTYLAGSGWNPQDPGSGNAWENLGLFDWSTGRLQQPGADRALHGGVLSPLSPMSVGRGRLSV